MDGIRDSSCWGIIFLTLGGTQELSLVPLPAEGSTKVPTGESSATSLPWMKKPLKVLQAAERVTIEVKTEMFTGEGLRAILD